MKNNLFTLHKLLIALISSFMLLFLIPEVSADSASDARLLASQCAQCHGTTGNTLGDFDSIAGESFSELYDELMEMKAEDKNEVMHKQIQGYSEAQIWLIADYYARFSEKTNTGGGGNNIDDEDKEDKDDEDDEDDEDDDDDDDEDDDDDDDDDEKD